jgi:hypothetical protein
VLTGVNWSAAIGGVPFRFPDYGGIDRVLASQRIYYSSPAIVAVHVATPLPSFADRGKAAILLTRDQAGAITKAVARITEEWNKARLAEEKARDAVAREHAKTAKAARRRSGGASATRSSASAFSTVSSPMQRRFAGRLSAT